MTHKRRENPQKAISKEWIAKALFDLMSEKPYKEITITEVSERADLARRTFYRHFETIDDVLDYILETSSGQFAAFLSEQPETDMPSFVRVFFEYWQQHKGFLMLLQKHNLLFLLLQKFMPAVRYKLHGDISTNPDAMILEYVFYFASGGLWNLLLKWLEDGAILKPEEMAEIANSIVERLN